MLDARRAGQRPSLDMDNARHTDNGDHRRDLSARPVRGTSMWENCEEIITVYAIGEFIFFTCFCVSFI